MLKMSTIVMYYDILGLLYAAHNIFNCLRLRFSNIQALNADNLNYVELFISARQVSLIFIPIRIQERANNSY